MKGALNWTVPAGDGPALGDVLSKMGGIALGAADEGRAFVNGRRAVASSRVEPGDAVTVHAARDPNEEGGAVALLARRGGLLVVDKPAGLPTTADRRGSRSLESLVADLVRLDAGRVHAASRLDVGVSGVVVVCLDRAANKAVERARELGEFHRVYLGVARGDVQGNGVWDSAIGTTRVRGRGLPSVNGRQPQPATTRYAAIGHAARGATLLRLEPVTGRTHQLRVHAAAAGAPLFGDRDRGAPRSVADLNGKVVAFERIALHARAIAFPLEDGSTLSAESPVPEALLALWSALGGDPAAWTSGPAC